MQSVSTVFNTEALATRRNISYDVRVAWTRGYDPSVAFATVGGSVVGGSDIIKGDSSQFITEADKFFYFNETDYVIQMEYERYIDEPEGGLSIAMGDLVLDNTTKRFTFGYDGTIGNYIIPQRVVRMGLGFDGSSIPVFEGVSKETKENRARRELYLHCLDYIDTFMGHSMDTEMFVNMRSDEIIEAILIDVGFNPSQYELDQGLNTIGFAWFESGTKASDAIKEICESEEGVFYQDENGILRFENREHYSWDPHLGVQLSLTTEDILEMEYDYGKIINKCVVYANPREEQAEQVVWTSDLAVEVPANDSVTVWAEYTYKYRAGSKDETSENVPCSVVVEPIEGTDFTSNTLSNGMGADMSAYLSLEEFSGFAQSAKMVFKNTHPTYSAYLTKLQVRGNPAIIVNTIKEEYQNSDSVLLYGEQVLQIDNNYIDDVDYAKMLARRIVDKYYNPLKRLVIKIKGMPHLQLKDKIEITDSDTSTTREYRLMKIRAVFNANEGFVQELTLREITATEVVESPHRVLSSKAYVLGSDYESVAGSFLDISSVGTIAWINTSLGNVVSSNNLYVTTPVLSSGQITHYLQVKDFSFAVPSGKTITGIQVGIEKKANVASSIKDYEVKIVKGGVIKTTNLASSAYWSTADETVFYGGISELWGETWTSSDINSSGFGVAISAKNFSAGGGKYAYIDNITIRVFYV